MNNKQTNFESLYSQYNVLVYNVVLNYLQNCEDAEEITQDVFVQIFNSIYQFEEKATIKTWIYRITINKCLDFIKHKNSKKRFFVFGKKSSNEYQGISVIDFEHPGILLENKENAAILYSAINQLNDNQKTAFILSKIDGQSNPEIAAIMELSISSVESLVFRAKKALQEKLATKFEENRKKQK